MSSPAKVAVVLAGYGLALAVATIALNVRLAHTNTAEAAAASGMYAFGDTALFLGVLFVASLPPTGAAFFFLRANRTFWTAIASVSIAIAMSGVAAWALHVFISGSAGERTLIGALAGLSPLRILAAPLFALAFLMSAFIAPHRSPRMALFLAAACEAAVSVYMAVVWFGPALAR